jgi:hypothetical protein
LVSSLSGSSIFLLFAGSDLSSAWYNCYCSYVLLLCWFLGFGCSLYFRSSWWCIQQLRQSCHGLAKKKWFTRVLGSWNSI